MRTLLNTQLPLKTNDAPRIASCCFDSGNLELLEHPHGSRVAQLCQLLQLCSCFCLLCFCFLTQLCQYGCRLIITSLGGLTELIGGLHGPSELQQYKAKITLGTHIAALTTKAQVAQRLVQVFLQPMRASRKRPAQVHSCKTAAWVGSIVSKASGLFNCPGVLCLAWFCNFFLSLFCQRLLQAPFPCYQNFAAGTLVNCPQAGLQLQPQWYAGSLISHSKSQVAFFKGRVRRGACFGILYGSSQVLLAQIAIGAAGK
mmetsp:Transcript_4331/g.8645  ORF Transcript_4331/g.8645 Transcript_4331/m.8645 type:complete len:257 (+) Transcript_4331:30-800(+)